MPLKWCAVPALHPKCEAVRPQPSRAGDFETNHWNTVSLPEPGHTEYRASMMFVWMLLQRLLGPVHLVLAPALRAFFSTTSPSVTLRAAVLARRASPHWLTHGHAPWQSQRSPVLAPIPIDRG